MADSADTGTDGGDAVRVHFGTMPDGRAVEAITLSNSKGLRATIITLGASLQSMLVPDHNGAIADVVLGYPSLEGYVARPEYFGATVGRVANRLSQARFTLDGETYHTPVNDGPNTLHGGTQGFDKAVWTIIDVASRPVPRVVLQHISPDGEQGYPGTLKTTAVYSLDEDDVLGVAYEATTDRPTIVNLSNHSYWNLAGEGSAGGAMNHLLTIMADLYTPTDAMAIPTGEMRPVEGTPFDFRRPATIASRVREAGDPQIVFGRGYDHNWVIGRAVAAEPRLLARLDELSTGRVMEVWSNQPGLQFYSGNFLDATVVGKAGKLYRQGDAIVLEAQMFPDTPNRPTFGSIRLEPGEIYRNVIQFRFATDAAPCEDST